MQDTYVAEATAIGGRSGCASSSDGALKVVLSEPASCWGQAAGTNPEQLFAAACAASFLEAIRSAALGEELAMPGDCNVTARISVIHRPGTPWPPFEILLIADLPTIDPREARTLLQEAERICPYTAALRGRARLQIRQL